MLRPFRLDGGHLSYTCLLSQQSIPTNPTPSSSRICSTSALVAILLQFLYVAPLPLITGKIPERNLFNSCLLQCLYQLSISLYYSGCSLPVCIVRPYMYSYRPPLACPNTFSTRSVTCSILAPGRQTTTSSP